MPTTVAVLGGGVGGLSAAHELAERGFAVTVYETRGRCGGKARSYPTPDGFPAEHGFRFFPGFYRHLPDTMSRIPVGGEHVANRLVGAERILLARAGGANEIIAPAHAPESLDDLRVLARFVWDAATSIGVPAVDVAWLIERLFTLLASCDARRVEQWDRQSWWDYVQADRRSEPFRRFLADGLTRTLVAARAKEMSARTGGLVLVQLLLDLARAGARADRVLDAPTSDAWITPWEAHLRSKAVTFHNDAPVEGLTLRNGRIASATVAGAEVTADFYVAALPVEVMRTLLSPELRRAAPALNGLDRLVTRWMNGILFYLDKDLPLVRGHTIYIDSEWALTSISQRQFWRTFPAGIGGVLSIDISEWQRAGRRTGKVAALCTPEEIRGEVWGQLQDHLEHELDGIDVVSWFLDEAITFPNPSGAVNAEPLLVNTAGSWADRPEASLPGVPNLLLAADYVRTYTDLATMEGANEAARRAVNTILEAVGSRAKRCAVWPLREPGVLQPLRLLDRALYRLHRPPPTPVRVSTGGEVSVSLVGRLLGRF
jgi:uncharacterized protein with NAD-binding domain and iron-sulfur cluster